MRQRAQERSSAETEEETNRKREDLRQRAQERIAAETEGEIIQRREDMRQRMQDLLANENNHNANSMRQQRNIEAVFTANNAVFQEQANEQHNLGQLNCICQFCAAKHFPQLLPQREVAASSQNTISTLLEISVQ